VHKKKKGEALVGGGTFRGVIWGGDVDYMSGEGEGENRGRGRWLTRCCRKAGGLA